MEVEKIIRGYLAEVLHMSLATSSNNQPWVCEVHFVYDKDLNLYFRSLPSRRHSQEIAKNPKVAGNIVEQHSKEQAPRAVYFEGTAEITKDIDENHEVYKSFVERLGASLDILDEAKSKDGHQIYKITVKDYYLFDARESKPSQKHHLAWKIAPGNDKR